MESNNSIDDLMKKLNDAYELTMIIEFNIRRIGFEINKVMFSNNPYQILPKWYEIKLGQLASMQKDVNNLLHDVYIAQSKNRGKHSVN